MAIYHHLWLPAAIPSIIWKKIEANISIQYKVMSPYRFRLNVALRRPSWFSRPWKNNSGLHIEVFYIFPQVQRDPSIGSLVIAAEKNVADGQTDRQTDRRTGQKHICLQPVRRRHNNLGKIWVNLMDINTDKKTYDTLGVYKVGLNHLPLNIFSQH